MGPSFKFKDVKELMQSEAEKNKHLSALDYQCDQIITIHQKIKNRQTLTENERCLLDAVLDTVICNIMHDRAETEFWMGEGDAKKNE
jgi:hypothetical protein